MYYYKLSCPRCKAPPEKAEATMPDNEKYRLLWKCKAVPEGITREEIDELNEREIEVGAPAYGACDAALICSVIYPPDGSFSLMLIPVDGRSKDEHDAPATMDDLEMFKIWLMMSKRLAESRTLDENRRSFAEAVFASFVRAMRDLNAEKKE